MSVQRLDTFMIGRDRSLPVGGKARDGAAATARERWTRALDRGLGHLCRFAATAFLLVQMRLDEPRGAVALRRRRGHPEVPLLTLERLGRLRSFRDRLAERLARLAVRRYVHWRVSRESGQRERTEDVRRLTRFQALDHGQTAVALEYQRLDLIELCCQRRDTDRRTLAIDLDRSVCQRQLPWLSGTRTW